MCAQMQIGYSEKCGCYHVAIGKLFIQRHEY